MDYPVLSVSKIKSWKACRRKYYYKSILNIRPKVTLKPFYLGSVIHEGVEAYLETLPIQNVIDKYINEFNQMDESTQEFYGFDFPELITGILKGYEEYWGPKDEKLIVHAVELDFGYDNPVEVAKNLFIRGRVDAIVENEKGLWIMEHKTCKSMPADAYRFTDLQTSLYQEALEKLGWKDIRGSLYDYIRKKVPSVPETLMRGGLSKKKNIDTTYEVYLRTIKEHKLNPDDYKDILLNLKAKGNQFFKRAQIVKPQVLRKSFLEDAQSVSEEIAQVREDGNKESKFYRNLGLQCNNCEYRALCEAELMDYDVDFLIKNSFIQKNDEESTEEESQE